MSPTAVSAPGKVLLAGGYLVLDRAYTGLVFGLSARMHVLVRDPLRLGTSHQETGGDALVYVRSPQFRDAEWTYQARVRDGDSEGGGGVVVTQLMTEG